MPTRAEKEKHKITVRPLGWVSGENEDTSLTSQDFELDFRVRIRFRILSRIFELRNDQRFTHRPLSKYIMYRGEEGLCCKPKYRANIIHHFFFVVFFLYFSYQLSPFLPQDQSTVTGRISPIYEKYYKLMKVLYIFPMIFKVKPISNLIQLIVSLTE